jgi:membrane protein implicated in regulation of membrane protease activity
VSAALGWLIAGLILLTIEVLSVTLVLGFFGLGALAAAVAAYAEAGTEVQTAVFVAASLATLALLRGRLRGVFGGRSQQGSSERVHPLMGSNGRATRAIRAGVPGEVEVGGSFWRAVAQGEIAEGRAVRVTGTSPGDEMLLVVEAAD